MALMCKLSMVRGSILEVHLILAGTFLIWRASDPGADLGKVLPE